MDRHLIAPNTLAEAIDRAAAAIELQLVAWRRDLHQHPELGNREFRTAHVVAEHRARSAWSKCAPASRTPASWGC